MLHLGSRSKNVEVIKNNDRYSAKDEETQKSQYNDQDSFKSPISMSSKILPNRSIKLKPIENQNVNLLKVFHFCIFTMMIYFIISLKITEMILFFLY